ncbi:DUF6883 domain-containing protein [Asticcacaulis taihuensis]|uniref:DUF6883 domain-containing protein n=1 Tax=Asticcacaulis taihuensis TaxID=260084 RepID=A0A1G4PVN7_9CAUL|nr:DUF6883 domain-containing protein [Asticcacaulis taihuensis]SCW36297.1 hypothetical protein SAMN02927928_0697 [Asticcacaulis taihuensis]
MRVPIVFMFNSFASGVPDWYGGHFDAAFLQALSSVDPVGESHTAVYRGDALVSDLATKVTAVHEVRGGYSYTQSSDPDLLRTIVWDFADALACQAHSVDQEDFPIIFGMGGAHCIFLPTFTRDFAVAMDKILRATAGYLGYVEIDLANPLQRKLYVDFLIKDAAIVGGQVITELSSEGEDVIFFSQATAFKPNGSRVVPYGDLRNFQPALKIPTELSARGKLTLDRYEGKKTFSLQEKVLAALARSQQYSSTKSSFSIGLTPGAEIPLEAILPENKFKKYLLDSESDDGASKAKFFREQLDIGPNDWRYLAAQFHDGLLKSDLVQVHVKKWETGSGVKFNATMPIVGRNGKTVYVETNWIMKPGNLPSFSTAFPGKRPDAPVLGTPPPVLPAEVVGDARWEGIFALASEAGCMAATSAVPTPMAIRGFGIEMEGMCGHAAVRVFDTKGGFGKWAMDTGHASRHYKSGARISARVSSQSVDRAIAYATAFATVLSHNGIGCVVETRLT